MPKVIPKEEVEQWKGKPVFYESRVIKEWVLLSGSAKSGNGKYNYARLTMLHGEQECRQMGAYGKSWRLWDAEPTEEQMKHWADIVRPYVPAVELRGVD